MIVCHPNKRSLPFVQTYAVQNEHTKRTKCYVQTISLLKSGVAFESYGNKVAIKSPLLLIVPQNPVLAKIISEIIGWMDIERSSEPKLMYTQVCKNTR